MSATITWLGHATVRLVLPDQRAIFIDPWLTENPACPAEFKNPPRCDLILCTHGHSDHTGEVKTLVKKFNPVVVGNYDLCSALQRVIGKARYSGMNTGGTQSVAGVRVSLTQAFHSSSIADPPEGPIYAGMPNGVVVSAEGLSTLYHAGDTDVFGDMRLIAQLYAPKVCCLPIGDYFTMGARGAALAAEMLQPKAIIPIHYQTFPLLAQSADALHEALSANLKSSLLAARPGQDIVWTATGAQLP